MKLIAIVVMIFSLSAWVNAQEYSLDTYRFEWTVAEIGKVELLAIKTDEGAYIQLYKSGGLSSSLRLSASEAAAIGKALVDVNKYAEKQKGSQTDVSDSVSAGDHTVYFRTSTKYGFSVTIRGESALESFVMERPEANALRPHLEKADEIISFLDRKIGGQLSKG